MTKYRKKPVVIEATQWFKDGDHPHVLMCWFDDSGKVRWAPGDHQSINIFGCVQKPAIATLEGWHAVTPGDFIITGVKGEHYPCKPDIFELTYELAQPAQPEPVAKLFGSLPVYETTPPQREWVGLTDTERNDIWKKEVGWGDPSHDDEDLMKAIEQALKEKNT